MGKGRIFRIVSVGFMLLLLIAVSTFSAAAQDPPVSGEAQAGAELPEIRAAGFSYTHEESLAMTGRSSEWKDGLLPAGADMSPSAVEGQPKRLDWTPVRRVAVRPGYPQTLYAAIDNGYGLYRSTNGGTFWEQLPFGVGSARTIVFFNSSIAIATFGYYDSGAGQWVNGGIWRTGDGGNTWQDVGAGIANTVVAIAFDPTNSARLYAGTYGAGIYRGDYSAGSVTWTQINSGLSDTSIYSVAVSPSSPNVLYAGGYTWVYRSDNYGDSWVIADNNYPSWYTEAVAVHRTDPNTFYAGAQRLGWVLADGLTAGGFYKSVAGAGDGNLVLKNVGMQETFVLDIVKDPLNANILYAGTWGSGLFRSDDGGDNWVAKNAGLETPFIYGVEAVADAGSPSGVTLYVATFYSGAGTYVSTDRGETWTDPWMSNFPSMFDITTTSSPTALAAATAYGVFISPDGGGSWFISNDLTNQRNGIVLELARDPGNASKLLAATYGGGIWTSTDAGANWSETSAGIGGGAYVFDVAFSTASNTAYAGSWGVYRTTDGGATWAPFGSLPYYVRDVDGHNASSPSLFAGTNDAGVFMSPNANGTWTDITGSLPDHRIRSLKALGSNQVFAGTNGSSAWEYTGSWTQKGPFIRAPGVIQIAIHPTNDAIIYAGTDQGVYRSANGGESWVPKNQGLGGYGDLVISGISIDPSNPTTIYLGTWGYGVFKSTDSGDHWSRLSDPLKSTKVYLPLVLRNYAPPVVELVNGNFEQGPTVGWGQYADHGYNIIWDDDPLPVDAHSGSWLTWLGGAYDNFSVIWQDATIPASDPWVRFYRWDASEDLCGYDYGIVFIDGTPVAAWNLCADDNTGGWVWSGVDLSAYAGQTVEVAIGAETDGSLNSNSYIDDVTLGYFASPDLGVQEAPSEFDEAALLQMIPDLGGAQRLASEPPFRPSGKPSDLPGLLNLSD